MTSAVEPPADRLEEVLERLANPSPALLLLRYRAASLPTLLGARLREHPQRPRVEMVPYDANAREGGPGSAVDITAQCARLAGTGSSPALLLAPRYPDGGELSPTAATIFWQRLNAQREALGNLEARILLCLDPIQEAYAAAYAKDLLSWCAPKFTLLATHLPGEERREQPARPDPLDKRFAGELLDQSRLQNRALSPLWQELLASGRQPSVAEIKRLGLPLLESALAEGRWQEAEAIAQIIAAAELPDGPARGAWLRLQGDLARARGKFAEATRAYEDALQLQDTLLQESPRSHRAKRELAMTLNSFADFLRERGQPGDMARALPLLQRDLRLTEQILQANSASAQAERDVWVSLERMGDFLTARGAAGDAERALGYYQRGLEVAERLLGANPESAQAATDFAISSERVADFKLNRGQVADALSHYETSRKIWSRFHAANPESAALARGLSVVLNKLADFLAARGLAGDAEKALDHYQRSLEVRERLLGSNPESVQAVRDVSVSLNKLGEGLATRGLPGDAEEALGHYQRGLEVRERLFEANPESAQAARDVSVSLDRLGDLLASRGLPGDAEKALGRYQRSLEVRERLLVANPDSVQAARDLSLSLERLGDFLASRRLPGDAEKALGHYQRSLEVSERLLGASPESAQAARDVWISCVKLAALAEQTGQGDALAWWRNAFAILDRMRREGRFLSAQDERTLEQLRLKVGG